VNNGQTRAHLTDEGEVGGFIQLAQKGLSVGQVHHYMVQAIVEHVGKVVIGEHLVTDTAAVFTRDQCHLANGAGELGVVQAQIKRVGFFCVQVPAQPQVVRTAASHMRELIVPLDPIDREIVTE